MRVISTFRDPLFHADLLHHRVDRLDIYKSGKVRGSVLRSTRFHDAAFSPNLGPIWVW
jgi:hypothetical protein